MPLVSWSGGERGSGVSWLVCVGWLVVLRGVVGDIAGIQVKEYWIESGTCYKILDFRGAIFWIESGTCYKIWDFEGKIFT